MKKRKKRMSPLMKLLIFLLLVGAIGAAMSLPVFQVTNYKVEGNSYYSDDEILVMGKCQTGGNIFWGSHLSKIKERLVQDAYMQEVTVKRSLPDTIVIQITERHQTAAMVYGDSYVVIDGNGVVLRKTDVEPKIPVLKGLTISKLSVGETIQVEEEDLLSRTLKMLSSMEQGDMFFKKVEISELQVRAYVYDGLICRGTPENLAKAIDAGNLQLVIQELFDRDIQRGTIEVTGEEEISFTPKVD